MHDTAFHIGALAMNTYADLRSDSVLEIGAQDVNGSLREHALPVTHYVGIDFDEGDGVDLIAEPGKPLPVEDDSFDLVLASSVFEHDPCFWVTFLEMCRVTKEGGYIYINAPSNGVVHRYPMDNWRFYPDSGKALVQWAHVQGFNVTLVESFIADREMHMWNDFVAVIRKGRITKPLPGVFLHQQVPCSNIITWKSKEVLRPSEEPQDMILLREARERFDTAQGLLAEAALREATLGEEATRQQVALNETTQREAALSAEAVQLTARLSDAEERARIQLSERQALEAELATRDGIRGELNLRESELRQRQEEIEQTRSELGRVQAERDDARAKLEVWEKACAREQDRADELNIKFESRLEELHSVKAASEKELSERCAEVEALKGDLRKHESALAKAAAALEENEAHLRAARQAADAAARASEGKLAERYQEITTLTRLMRQQQEVAELSTDRANWLLALSQRLAEQPRWWSLMPKFWGRRRRLRGLRLAGLFDGDSYLRCNPDVSGAGQDPLDHYLKYGMSEGRARH